MMVPRRRCIRASFSLGISTADLGPFSRAFLTGFRENGRSVAHLHENPTGLLVRHLARKRRELLGNAASWDEHGQGKTTKE